MIEELQLVFTVRDKGAVKEFGFTYAPKFTGAMVKLLQWHQRGSVNPIHGIVEVEPWPISLRRSPRFFTGEKIYSLAHIIRGAHVVLATLLPVQYWFVNNYIDWDQFNTLYDKDFETKGTRTADKIACLFK